MYEYTDDIARTRALSSEHHVPLYVNKCIYLYVYIYIHVHICPTFRFVSRQLQWPHKNKHIRTTGAKQIHFLKKVHTLMRPIHIIHTQKSPANTQKSLTHTQKSPAHTQKSPAHTQKSPTHTQKSPTCAVGNEEGRCL